MTSFRLAPSRNILLLLTILCTGGCVFQSRIEVAQSLAAKAQFHGVIYHTTGFDLQAYARFSSPTKQLMVYLEGDGAAWKNRYNQASDPTPKNPTGLHLATQDPHAAVLYLARPCQYMRNNRCSSQYWGSHRYSQEIVEAISHAIDQTKQTHGMTTITLVGYSGGGVLAALVAAQRQDVDQFITIAANLDINSWTTLHHVSPLWGSENPTSYAATLQHIRQTHIIGDKDRIVPIEVLESYLQSLPNRQQAQTIILPGATHHNGWQQHWPTLLHTILAK